MNAAPKTLPEALNVIRAMHTDLLAFRHPEFDMIAPGREGDFDDRVKSVLAHSAPVIKADRHASDWASDVAIETEIQAKGLAAPCVTLADIEALITHTFYANLGDAENANWPDPNARDESHPALTMTTVCTLVTKNGHSVVGVAYCADPAKFNTQTGCDTARADAIRQLRPMVIYGERLAAAPSIKLTPAEIQSGHDRVRWAEGLIRQLPVDHDGRNSWLLNYSTKA